MQRACCELNLIPAEINKLSGASRDDTRSGSSWRPDSPSCSSWQRSCHYQMRAMRLLLALRSFASNNSVSVTLQTVGSVEMIFGGGFAARTA
jgi:hypothetical protein